MLGCFRCFAGRPLARSRASPVDNRGPSRHQKSRRSKASWKEVGIPYQKGSKCHRSDATEFWRQTRPWADVFAMVLSLRSPFARPRIRLHLHPTKPWVGSLEPRKRRAIAIRPSPLDPNKTWKKNRISDSFLSTQAKSIEWDKLLRVKSVCLSSVPQLVVALIQIAREADERWQSGCVFVSCS